MIDHTLDRQGRYRLYYDFLEMTYYFVTSVNDSQGRENHRMKRTVTQEEVEVIDHILGGGFIKAEGYFDGR